MEHLRFPACLLELQSDDYRNFMLHVLLAVFKICSHLLFCRAVGTDRALWCCRKCQCCQKYAKYGLDCRICCKFGIYEPYLLQVWLIVPNLLQVWQRCSGSTNLALFGQRQPGNTRLQTHLQTQPQYFWLCCQKLIGQLKLHGRGF